MGVGTRVGEGLPGRFEIYGEHCQGLADAVVKLLADSPALRLLVIDQTLGQIQSCFFCLLQGPKEVAIPSFYIRHRAYAGNDGHSLFRSASLIQIMWHHCQQVGRWL
jgi:hypothetical protein